MTLKFSNPKNSNEDFLFTNNQFINSKNSNEKYKVLEYSENFEGWSDNLTKLSDDKIGDNHPIDVASREFCIYLIKKYSKTSENIILEIGCSSGNLINQIKKKIKNYIYIGSDVLKKPIYKLSKKYEDIPFIRFDITRNPLGNNFCNTIIMLNVLEHIKDDLKAIEEAHNLLIHDGLLIIEVPACRYIYDNYDKQLNHFRRYNMKDIVNKLKKNGFKIEKKTHIGFLIFPIFLITKIINKIFKPKNIFVKQSNFSNNFIVKILFKFESILRYLYLPFGIRCVICARKI